MRWKSPAYGDTREREFFAWLPFTTYLGNGVHETRWLEKVRVKEEYVPGGWGDSSSWSVREVLDIKDENQGHESTSIACEECSRT